MKKIILIFCVILALLLSAGSFTLALSMKNAKDDTPKLEESLSETEPAPVIKTFTFYIWGSGAGSPEYQSKHGLTFSYEEGMTWAEFCASDYNTDGMFQCNDPDYPYIYGPVGCTVVSVDEALELGEYPDETSNYVSGPDVISSPYYGSDT